MANPLIIRFTADTQTAKKGVIDMASTIVAEMMKSRVSMAATAAASDAMQSHLVGNFARAALAGVGLGAAIVAGFKLTELAYRLAVDQVERFVAIGDKATRAGVGTTFWQAFIEGAKKAGAAAEEAERALQKAFDATRVKLGEKNDIDSRVKDLFDAGNFGRTGAIDQFNASRGQEEKIRAVLALMQEAYDRGERLAALDIGEKMFGPAFVDRLRAGVITIDQLIAQIEKASLDKELISPADIARAEALNERLKEAHDKLENALKPVMRDIADAGHDSYESWVRMLGLLADLSTAAVGLYDKLKTIPGLLPSIGSAMTGLIPGYNLIAAWLARKAALDVAAPPAPDQSGVFVPLNPKLPGSSATATQRRTQELSTPDRSKAPQKDKKFAAPTKEQLDAIEQYVLSLQKANEVLEAEISTEGKSNVEKNIAIALAKAAAAARQDYERGRRDSAELTAKETADVTRLAEAHGKLEDRLKNIRQAQQQAAETARYFGQTLSDAIGELIVDGKSFSDVLRNMVTQLAKAAIQATILGTGPLASLLNMAAPASAGPNGLGGLLGLFFGGGTAAGPSPAAPSSFPTGIYHAGGMAGSPPAMRRVDPKIFDAAQRLHSGLKPDEFPAILQTGEAVLTRAQQMAVGAASYHRGMLAGGGMGGGARGPSVFNVDARGAQIGVEQKILEVLKAYDRSRSRSDGMRAASSGASYGSIR